MPRSSDYAVSLIPSAFRLVMCAMLLSPAGDAVAQSSDSLAVLERIAWRESGFRQIAGSVYDNPALKQFVQDFSFTCVGAGCDKEHQGEAVSTQAGTGKDQAYFKADTYIRHKNTTLFGEGSYSTGHRFGPVWNEVADAELVYPYLTADAVGGDINDETYRFAGGYSSYDGRVAWGVSLGYTAGHHYRDVDPRPRNVTGCLELAAGAAYRLVDTYLMAVGGDFMKYKQTSDIDFMSELGQTAIYHLTGLGTDYVRFRGNGFTTYYDGRRYGLQVNVTPEDGNGLSATLHLSRLTMETILNDMNKLPLNGIWHNALYAEIGYKRRGRTTWGVSADCKVYRRHGKENFFGDAASSTYPQIGSVEMYADNAYDMTATGLVEHSFGKVLLAYTPVFGYSHRCQIYADPAREWLVNDRMASQSIKAGCALGSRWYGALRLSWAIRNPVSSSLITGDADNSEGGLMDALYSDFRYASSTRRSYSATADVRYAINRGNALQLSVGYSHDSYGFSTSGNRIGVNAAVLF